MKSNWLILGGFALILVLPLLNLPPWFAPPEWSKALVFRALAFLGIAGMGWALVAQKPLLKGLREAVWPHKGLLLLLGGYVGVLLLSTLFSGNVQQGLLGVPLRGGGVVDLLLLFSFTVVLLAFVREQGWNTLWKVAIATGVLVSLVALLQQFSSFSEVFVTGVSRPGSTIGGPAFLASYLLLLLFPALAFGFQSRRPGSKALYLGAALLFITVIILGLTRGAWLGLFLGLAWFVGWYPSRHSFQKKARFLILVVLVLGILGIAYLNIAQLPKAFQDIQFFSTLQSRLQVDSLLEARLGTWIIAWEAAKDRFLFGYGYENASVGLNKHFDPSLPGIPPVEWWPDRGHNIILDTLLAGGIAVLAFFALFLFVLFRKLQLSKDSDSSNPIFLHAAQALLVGYVTANLFSFDSFSIQLLFFFAMGWALSLIQPPSEQAAQRQQVGASLVPRLLGAGFIPLALILAWQLSVSPLLANAKTNVASTLAQETQCEKSVSLFENILLGNHLSLTQTHIEIAFASAIDRCVQQDSSLASLRIKQYQLLKDVAEQRGNHAESWIDFGGLATTLGERAINQNQPEIATQLLQEAENAFLRGQELSPKRPQLLERWAVKELIVENYESAQEKAQQCVELQGKRGSCWWWKGIAEIFQGNIQEADKSIERAEQEGYNVEGNQQLANLARAYAVAGEYALAREAAEKLLELRPGSREEIEAFLNSLPR